MNDKNNQIKETSQETDLKEYIYKENKLKKFGVTFGLLLVTIVVFIFFAVVQPRFMTERNIFNLLAQGSIIGILALGLTNIIISGNFDISFAANAGICAILLLFFVGQFKIPLLIAYLLIIAFSLAISTINGLFVVYAGLPSFIATLGMQAILFGFSKWLTKGSVMMFPYLPPAFKIIGKGKIGGVFPVALLIFLLIAFFGIVFLEMSYKGKQFYAVGSNLMAAVRVGINVKKIKFQAFLIMGVVAGIGGITMGSLFEAANPNSADSFLFPAIIVAFLGAVFLKEGIPNVLGTVIAAILMSALANGFTLLGFPLWIKEFVQGFILLFAISIISLLKPGGIPPVNI